MASDPVFYADGHTPRRTDTELQVTQKILGALVDGAGGTAGQSGNYGGGQPNFTPAGGFGVAIDTSNGRVWWYYNNQWN